MAAYIVAGIVAVVMAIVGGLATDVGPWYRALKKPPWNPPDWLFGPAWTVIYGLMVWATGLTWNAAPEGSRWLVIAVPFGLNVVLNMLWSIMFFRVKRPDWALLEVLALWLSTASMVYIASLYTTQGAWMLAVYLCWVTFAGSLNYSIVARNKPVVL